MKGSAGGPAAFALLFLYRLSNKMSPSLFNVSHLLQLTAGSSDVHRRAAMLGLEICAANGLMLTKR